MAGIEDLNSLTQFKLGVAAGLYDNDLESITTLVRMRKSLLQAQADADKIASLNVDDRVCVTDKCSPKYLIGAYGTVTGFDGDKIKVLMDQQIRRYSRNITFHPVHLRKVVPG